MRNLKKNRSPPTRRLLKVEKQGFFSTFCQHFTIFSHQNCIKIVGWRGWPGRGAGGAAPKPGQAAARVQRTCVQNVISTFVKQQSFLYNSLCLSVLWRCAYMLLIVLMQSQYSFTSVSEEITKEKENIFLSTHKICSFRSVILDIWGNIFKFYNCLLNVSFLLRNFPWDCH